MIFERLTIVRMGNFKNHKFNSKAYHISRTILSDAMPGLSAITPLRFCTKHGTKPGYVRNIYKQAIRTPQYTEMCSREMVNKNITCGRSCSRSCTYNTSKAFPNIPYRHERAMELLLVVQNQGAVSIWRWRLTSIGIPITNIRLSHDRIIFIQKSPYSEIAVSHGDVDPTSFLALLLLYHIVL